MSPGEAKVVDQERLAFWMLVMVKDHQPPGRSHEFDMERGFLIGQLTDICTGDAWWSDEEWEWFLGRYLDHVEGTNASRKALRSNTILV
jgi:hypothetical protein